MSNRPIRILDCRDSPWVDGPGRTILQVASMVDRARCEIIIGAFCGKSHGDHAYMQEAQRLGLQLLPIIEESAFDRRVLKQISHAIKKESIDILHTHDFRSHMFGLLCAKMAGIPIMATCHGWIANNRKGKIYMLIDKFTLRFFDCVIAVSDRMGRQLQEMGIRPDRIRVIRNALVLDEYQPDRAKQEFRRELGVSDNTRIIANIGRLSQEKGQDIFLQAAQVILQDHQDVLFVLIGIGPEEDRLREMAKALDIEKYLVFAGYRKNMREIYNSLDLVVQSSYTEGMPNVILESLLMEVPVVATKVGGTAEVVQDQQTGVLIEPHDLGQLVMGIASFLQNSSWHRQAVKKGRLFVSQNFDHKKRVELLMDSYDAVSLLKKVG